MKKILYSALGIGATAAIAIAATGAFFSDTETSSGNTFTAGAIDLLVDNDSWYYGPEGLVHRDDLSWDLDNLTGHLFFNYEDLKPGDWGEDTISLHVRDNDAYACAYIDITKNDDMSSTDPELEVQGEVAEDPGNIWDGELAQELNFFFWLDDGDNVYEVGEPDLMQGPASNGLPEVLTYELVNPANNGALVGGLTYYIGKVWCYGDLVMNTVTQDGQGAGSGNGPDQRHTGVICSGENVTNISQTDNMMLDMSFYAEQARHNETFECPVYQGATVTALDLENKDDQSGWAIIGGDDTWGTLAYSSGASTFYGTLYGQGLVPGAPYQFTFNGPGGCSFTDDGFAGLPGNAFSSGYWNNGTNLEAACGLPGEGVHNVDLVTDWYTARADATGRISKAFNLPLPSGNYTGVKVLVKQMLDPFVSPWAELTAGYAADNLYETSAINFTVN